jgi:hypothetical protein
MWLPNALDGGKEGKGRCSDQRLCKMAKKERVDVQINGFVKWQRRKESMFRSTAVARKELHRNGR